MCVCTYICIYTHFTKQTNAKHTNHIYIKYTFSNRSALAPHTKKKGKNYLKQNTKATLFSPGQTGCKFNFQKDTYFLLSDNINKKN